VSAPSSSPGPQAVHPELAGGRLQQTPTSQLAVNGGSQHPDKRKRGGHGPTLADEVEHLLPTPRTSDTNGTGTHGTGGPDLRTVVAEFAPRPSPEALLPTPRATDGAKGGPNQRGSSGDLMLPSAVARLLPTPDATHGRKTTRTGPLLPGVVETLLPTPTATPYGNNQSPSPNAAVRPSLDALAPKLLPTPLSSRPGTTANFRPDGTPYGYGYGPTLLDAVRMLPTPTAADGERTSKTMPRGNPTLAGAAAQAASPGSTPSTPPPSRAGRRSSGAPHPGQLTIEDA
jgi:hypothetical protein